MDLKQKMNQIMIPDSPSPFSNEDNPIWSAYSDDDDVFESNIDIVISKPSDEIATNFIK